MPNIHQRIIAFVLLIALLPVIVMIAIAILIDSRGWPIFTQTRIGKGGKPFTLYKLRTMKIGEEPRGIQSRILLRRNQSFRVTRIGKPLRKFHLDELPQLWNIVIGDMVFVGPRPLAPQVIGDYYGPRDNDVFPGLTGLVQISDFWHVEKCSTERLDKFYCERRSMLLDALILAKTISYLFRPRADA